MYKIVYRGLTEDMQPATLKFIDYNVAMTFILIIIIILLCFNAIQQHK